METHKDRCVAVKIGLKHLSAILLTSGYVRRAIGDARYVRGFIDQRNSQLLIVYADDKFVETHDGCEVPVVAVPDWIDYRLEGES